MMPRRFLITLLATGLALAVSVGDSPAQYNPYYRPGAGKGPPPPLSPYLNLLRGRNSAVNYYFGVQPYTDPRTIISQQQQQLLGEERKAAVPTETELFPTLPGTGHPVGFMNYGGYYSFGTGTGTGAPVMPAAKQKRQ